jgi:hypothetical protein
VAVRRIVLPLQAIAVPGEAVALAHDPEERPGEIDAKPSYREL